MTAPRFKLIMDRSRLVLCNVVMHAQSFSVLGLKTEIQLICHHLVRAALKGKQFSGVIVP